MGGRALPTLFGASLVACSLGGDWGAFSAGEKGLTEDGGGVADSGASDADASSPLGETGAPSDPYGDEVRKDGPVAWYRFEDDLGGASVTLTDSIGQRNAAVDGPISSVPGVSGRAVSLGGGTSLVVGDEFDFAGMVPFALELWVQTNVSQGENQHLVVKRASAGELLGYIAYLAQDRTVHFETWGAQMSAWTESPIATGYTHIVVSVSYASGRGNATLWVDGNRAPHGGFDNTSALANTSVPLVFGEHLRGALDEIAIYDKALPEERVLAHYRAGRP